MPPVDGLFKLAVIACGLVIAWLLAVRFSPDPLVTTIVQVILFLVAIWVVVTKVFPLFGIS